MKTINQTLDLISDVPKELRTVKLEKIRQGLVRKKMAFGGHIKVDNYDYVVAVINLIPKQ